MSSHGENERISVILLGFIQFIALSRNNPKWFGREKKEELERERERGKALTAARSGYLAK